MFFPFSIRLLQLWLDYAHKILVVTIYDVHSLDVLQLVAVVKQWVKTERCQAVAESRRELKISKVIFQFRFKISLGHSEGLKRPGYQVIHTCLWWFLYQSLFNSAETGYFFPTETEPFQTSAENNFAMFTTLSNLKNMNFLMILKHRVVNSYS